MSDSEALIADASDADFLLAYLLRDSHDATGHHPRCRTREDEGCDCYARRTFPARAALARLNERIAVLERALRAISENANSYHGDANAKQRALNVIGCWATWPNDIPEGIGNG